MFFFVQKKHLFDGERDGTVPGRASIQKSVGSLAVGSRLGFEVCRVIGHPLGSYLRNVSNRLGMYVVADQVRDTCGGTRGGYYKRL